MPTSSEWLVFLGTAIVLAITPGPAMVYVLSRTLHGGRREGVLSALGNAIGDLAHVLAAALGLSALLTASPIAFAVVKALGAGYLVFLGVRSICFRRISTDPMDGRSQSSPAFARSPLMQGVIVESLNPKSALYFMALLPHFVHPERAAPAMVISVLGLVVVTIALAADLTVALSASLLRRRPPGSSRWPERQRVAAGSLMIGLGAYVAAS